MKINFDAKVDFDGTYKVDNGTINVTVTDGNVTLEYLPVYTSGYLQVEGDVNNLLDETYTLTASTYDWDDDDEWIVDVEDDNDELMADPYSDEDEVSDDYDNIDLARKIKEYDKDGYVVKLLTDLLKKKDVASEKAAKVISEIMINIANALDNLKVKMQEGLNG